MITIALVETGEFALLELVSADFGPEASVTEHPVEIGSEVTDHVQIRPYRFTAEVFVSDSPRASSLATLRDTRQATAFFEGALGKLCNVTLDGEGYFANYVLEACPHAKGSTRGRGYSLRFRQIRLASAISVLLPPRLPAPAAQTTMPTEQDLGQQATVPVDVPPAESLAYSGAASLGSLLGLGG